MVLGNLLSGNSRVVTVRCVSLQATTDMVIVPRCCCFFAFGEQKTTSLVMRFICCAGLFALSALLEILLLQNAKGGEMLGAAGGQMAFNLGSAIGAYFGGMMITLWFSWSLCHAAGGVTLVLGHECITDLRPSACRRAQANARASLMEVRQARARPGSASGGWPRRRTPPIKTDRVATASASFSSDAR